LNTALGQHPEPDGERQRHDLELRRGIVLEPEQLDADRVGCGVTTAAGFSNGTTNGVLLSTTGTDPTRASLQSDYNNILTQIDQLAKDSS